MASSYAPAIPTVTATADPNNFNFTNFNFTEFILSQPVPWENRPGSIIGITMAIMGISAICVLFRLYIRLVVIRKPGWDDLFVVLFIITIGLSAAAVCLAPSFGMGRHLILIRPDEFRILLILTYIINASYVSATAFIKLSLAFQYLRIFQQPGTISRRFCLLITVLLGLWGFAFSIMAWFPCFPPRKYWDGLREGVCYGYGDPQSNIIAVHTALNMAFDLIILAIPIPLCFEKSSLVKSRIGMVVLLSLGFVVNAVAAWRLALLLFASSAASSGTASPAVYDGSFYTPGPVLLAAIEVGLASVCASVPIFWPVLSHHLGNVFSSSKFDSFHGPRLALNDDSAEELRLHPSHRDSIIKANTKDVDAHDSVMDHLDDLPTRLTGLHDGSHPDDLKSRASLRSHPSDVQSRVSVRSYPDDLHSRTSTRSHPDDIQRRISRVATRERPGDMPRRPSRVSTGIHEMDAGRDGVPQDINRKTWLDF